MKSKPRLNISVEAHSPSFSSFRHTNVYKPSYDSYGWSNLDHQKFSSFDGAESWNNYFKDFTYQKIRPEQ